MGNVIDAKSYYVVKVPHCLLGESRIQVGQWWSIEGELKKCERIINDYRISEWQCDATAATMLLPSGEHIITLMAGAEDFKGIGQVKARILWETLQDRIYDVLDSGDVATLSQVLTPESAAQVIKAWHKLGDTRTLQWLTRHGFAIALGRKVFAYFKRETADKIQEDPYRLLSFCGGWKEVDALARSTFGLAYDDPRRLQGAVEEALYRLFNDGHTVATEAMIFDRLQTLLKSDPDCSWRDLVPAALSQGFSNGSYVLVGESMHPIGPYVMETTVARAVVDRLLMPQEQQVLQNADIDTLLADHEATEDFALNAEQRSALHASATSAFVIITGDAGVGKTTMLKLLYKMYDHTGIFVYQLALAGRAAKRMQEATGRPARTIASFLQKFRVDDLTGPTAVVIDEASMVDIITMYRLCEILPTHVRIVLVGDRGQLMPVGPGLVLHALVDIAEIPLVELKTVNRHSGAIVKAAQAIRQGIWPDMPADENAPVAFLPCPLKSPYDPECGLAETVLRLYKQDPNITQILSSRHSNRDGVDNLNIMCQDSFARDARKLLVWSDKHDSWAGTGFRLGDKLLCTRNMWNYGLQNGSLGVVTQIENKQHPHPLTEDTNDPFADADEDEADPIIAWAEWDDGESRPIYEHMLDDLQLGYVITIHKSQGSQWPRIIVPIINNRILDRTLIYTALTRSQKQIILVGDPAVARKAVETQPKVHLRQVALGTIVRRMLKEVR